MLFLDCLYKTNTRLKSDHSICEKLQIKRIARGIIKISANTLLPMAFRITKQKKDRIGDTTLPLIVSLTSFPDRIGRVWMTIESMLRQTSKPKHIILWLSRDQFPSEECDLPKSLLKQTKRGLVIRFVDGDARSHKKYYYAFKEYTEYCVVTIDDDLLFPSYFLESIYECSLNHPNDVIANFGFMYIWDDEKQYLSVINNIANTDSCKNKLFFGSGGGTLFKPSNLLAQMDDLTTILTLCPTADDVYLNALIRISGFGVILLQNNPLLSIVNLKDRKLSIHNGNIGNAESENAKQIRCLTAYMKTKFGTNPLA